ncbi:hypothetical protein SEVIR_9G294850v4 [Setaria viridis]
MHSEMSGGWRGSVRRPAVWSGGRRRTHIPDAVVGRRWPVQRVGVFSEHGPRRVSLLIHYCILHPTAVTVLIENFRARTEAPGQPRFAWRAHPHHPHGPTDSRRNSTHVTPHGKLRLQLHLHLHGVVRLCRRPAGKEVGPRRGVGSRRKPARSRSV